MKNYIVLFVFLGLLFSCTKNNTETESLAAIEGVWELKEVLADPGDGSGTFISVTSSKNLVFHKNGTITSNGSLCDMSIESNANTSGTYSKTNQTISSSICPNFLVKYELDGNSLTLVYSCFEACRAKYIRVQ